MFKRILVPLDGSKMSELALEVAIELASGLHATIVVLRVVELAPGRPDLPNEPDPLLEAQRSEADMYVAQGCTRLTALGIDADCHVFVGDVAQHIIRFTDFEHCDLVVMSSHGLGGGGWHVFGSVAQKVLHAARLPVMIVGPGTEETPPEEVPQAETAKAGQ
jgi:nucleotide-binding universal stress UspA family protein